jgi:hypothetical protein
MAGTHEDFEDVKITLETTGAGEINQWREIVPRLGTRENIFLANTGVNSDGATAHSLDVRFFQNNTAVTGNPHLRLFAGDNFSANFAEEVRIGIRSNVLNGTCTLIESENVQHRGQRNYDTD